MSAPRCPVCKGWMTRHGRTSAGKQRWRCKACGLTKTNRINNDAKQLEEFLRWLLSKKTQAEMPGEGRGFRKRTARYLGWCERWDSFLSERTVIDGRSELTHYRLVQARASLNRLVSSNHLFTYLDDMLTIGGPSPRRTTG